MLITGAQVIMEELEKNGDPTPLQGEPVPESGDVIRAGHGGYRENNREAGCDSRPATAA
jgi:hypothetical protein